MAEYRLTRQAEDQLFEILVFGVGQFGLAQADAYQRDLENCLRLLAEMPRMGRLAPALGPSIRRHEHGRHTVLYEEEPGGILVFAIVHQASGTEPFR